MLPAPITKLCPVAVVVVAATVVILSVPSTSIVTFPVPLSATVTLLLPCEIAVVETAAIESSTYFLFANWPSALGAAVAPPVIVLAVADITISPTSNPLLTLKFLVVMVPYLPHDCY